MKNGARSAFVKTRRAILCNCQVHCGETDSDAVCARSGDRFSCSIKFRNLTPDMTVVESYLQTKYGNDGHLPARMAAAQAFERDAIGTLDILIAPH